MSYIGWGKCRIFVKDLDTTGAKYRELPTPVEGSTSLEATKGDKQEAKIEGGQNEDVKYKASTYALNLNIRAKKGRKKPFDSHDGLVAHSYEVIVVPEDTAVPSAIKIPQATVSVGETFDTTEGLVWPYSFEAVKPENGDSVLFGSATVATSGQPTFTEMQVESEPTA